MSINMVQKVVVEVDSIQLLEEYLRLAMATALNSQEEIAVKIVDRKKPNIYLPPVLMDQKKFFPVILISGWFIPKEEEKNNSYFDGYKPWRTFRSQEKTSAIDTSVQYIKRLIERRGTGWNKQFKKKFGEGYNDWFNLNDGSVGLGYELRSCYCFPECLSISIKHMYYGK